MKVSCFSLEGDWFDVTLDRRGIASLIALDPKKKEDLVVFEAISKEEMIKFLDEMVKELDDLKFKVTYDASEHIWNSLKEEEE